MQLPLVKKAREMDIETICFAWEEGAVCKNYCTKFYPVSILEREKILSICENEKIDGICSIASDAAVPALSFIADKMGLIANSPDDIPVQTNKFHMRQRLQETGVNSPHFGISNKGERPDTTSMRWPLIVKPVDRSGSRGVRKIKEPGELKKAVSQARAESFCHKAIAEEFISGDEVSVETISWEGKHYVLQITDKVTSGEPFYVELEHHQPSALNDKLKEKIIAASLKALDALNVRYGAGHSEFIVTRGGEVFCIEIGARMGGDFIGSHLVRLSTGYDFLKGVIETALGSFTVPLLNERNFSGVFFLSEDKRSVLPYIGEHHDDFIIESGFFGTTIRSVRDSTDRSGYLIYKSRKRIYL